MENKAVSRCLYVGSFQTRLTIFNNLQTPSHCVLEGDAAKVSTVLLTLVLSPSINKMTLLSYNQYYKLNHVLFRIVPFFSIVGSSAIIYLIVAEFFRCKRKLTRPSYQRIMLALCTNDIVWSIMYILGPVMVPSSVEWANGYGNTWTCTIQGILFAVGGVLESAK